MRKCSLEIAITRKAREMKPAKSSRTGARLLAKRRSEQLRAAILRPGAPRKDGCERGAPRGALSTDAGRALSRSTSRKAG